MLQVAIYVSAIGFALSACRLPWPRCHASQSAFSQPRWAKHSRSKHLTTSGCAELDLHGKVGPDTIWIEPFCLARTRRPTRYSARFARILAIRKRLERPRWSLSYTAKYDNGISPMRLLARLNRSLRFGHGWYRIEKRREIHGTLTTNDRRLSSRRQLSSYDLN